MGKKSAPVKNVGLSRGCSYHSVYMLSEVTYACATEIIKSGVITFLYLMGNQSTGSLSLSMANTPD
jgi:hypothetical protein